MSCNMIYIFITYVSLSLCVCAFFFFSCASKVGFTLLYEKIASRHCITFINLLADEKL